MPRGAIPTSRAALGASEPFRPDASSRVYVPSGRFPSPPYELAASQPYRASDLVPESALQWPIKLGDWKNSNLAEGSWAEEAFAKACGDPKQFVPPEEVAEACLKCGPRNLAEYMQTSGFRIGGNSYLNGPYFAVDWTKPEVLHSAVAREGPIKIVVALRNSLTTNGRHSQAWLNSLRCLDAQRTAVVFQCASIFGYGSSLALVDAFAEHGAQVAPPHQESPNEPCYAVFMLRQFCILSRQSLLSITVEAWVRSPTTIVRTVQ